MRLMQITTRTVAGMVLLSASLAAAATPVFQSAPTYNLNGGTADAIQGALAVLDVGSLDFTLDGIPDILTVQRNQLASILFGKGDGTFTTGYSADLGLIPIAFSAGLFDNDAQPDMLVANQDGSIVFFKGVANDPPFERQGDPISAGTLVLSQAKGFAVGKIDSGDTLDALVAIGSSEGGGLTVLLGDGNGGFSGQPTVKTGAGAAATAVVAGYFNGDDKLDAAVLNPEVPSVTVFHQNAAGTGVFTVKQTVTFTTGTNATVPTAIASGVLTGSGRSDLVVADSGNDRVLLLRALADGTFAAPEPFSAGTAQALPYDVTLADVSCFSTCPSGKTTDGFLDVVVANYYSSDVSVLAGDGQGFFAAPRQFVADQEPVSVAAKDLNHDGAADVVAISQGTGSSTTASVLMSAAGGLAGVENVITADKAETAIGGDVDGDGVADILVAEVQGDIVAYRADDSEGFAPVQVGQLPGAAGSVYLEQGDFNNDGRLDVVAANGATTTVSIFLARPRNGFDRTTNAALESPAQAVIAGDWNHDGNLDLALATQPKNGGSGGNSAQPNAAAATPSPTPSPVPGHVEVLLGRGDGTFDPATAIEVGASPAALGVGDFNKDGNADLAVVNSASTELSILLGDGVGGFVPGTAIPGIGGALSVAVADFDHDGSDDIAIALGKNGLQAYYGNGNGTFVKGPNPGSIEVASALVARDLTGDGLPDLLVSDQSNSNQLALLVKRPPGNTQPPDRRFLQQQLVRTSRQPLVTASADSTGKGRYDAFMVYNGVVTTVVGVATNVGGPAVVRGDGNGDGRVTAADALAAIRELNDGRYQRVEQVGGGAYPANAGVDSNGDGIVNPLDVVAAANRAFAGA